MKKLTRTLVIRTGLLMLAFFSTLMGYGQDTYKYKEILYDNAGNIFTIRPDDSWANTSADQLPAVLEKVYGATNVKFRTLSVQQTDRFVFTKYQQMYNNIDVFGGDIIVKRDLTGAIILINGCLRKVKPIPGLTIPPDTALKIAMDDLGDVKFHWQFDTLGIDGNPDIDAPGAAVPTPKLIYYMKDDLLSGDFILCYEMEIGTNEPAEYQIFVNAVSGQVMGRMNSIHPVKGSGNTLYSGNVSITIERFQDTLYVLEDSVRNIYTWDWDNKLTGAYYWQDRDTAFNANWQRQGVDVHWGMSRTYDFYKSDMNRNSFDNKGAKINNNVDYDTNYNNAFWSKRKQAMYYGRGDGNRFSPLVSLDVVGHEFTHAVVQHTAGLVYRKESGALNESFADIFGASIEKKQGGGNWQIGEDCFTPNTAGDALRDMSNPNTSSDPDCYEGTHWKQVKGCTPTGGKTGNDWCGVHSNSGVGNFWFYLLTDGGKAKNDKNNDYDVTGIGITKSALIAYTALSTYMNTTTDYKGARFATLQAAEDLYGKKSNEYKQVCNAWYAVNVGEKCCADSMEFDFDKTDPLCHDSKDGKLKVTVMKAKGPFTYEWYKNDTLGPIVGTDAELNGISKGDYWIWVRDTVAKCEKVEKTELEGPEELDLGIGGGGVHIRACDRKPEIYLEANGSGGTPPYTYNWENGRKLIASSGSVGTSGWYTAQVTDKNGCKTSRSTYAFFIPIRCSYDPNDIIGPPSYGDQKWVSVQATLPYKVRFENDPKFATAPAQKVTIDHPLDSNLDLASFRLSDFGFANYVFEVPQNSSYYSKRIDLIDSLGIYLDVTAGLNYNAKKAFWIFESIDPKTGLPPADANVGFLAVNDTNTHVGEGYVNYTVKPISSASTGDSIRSVAEIVFDNNPSLKTPRIHRLIDAVAPTSGIRQLPSLLDSVNIPLTLFGADDSAASGFGSWNIYVSEDGGSYSLYAQGLTDSVLSYRGNYGSEYRFISVGLDNVSNKEGAKSTPDLTVTIAPDRFLKELDSTTSLCALDTLEIKWFKLNIPSFKLEYSSDSGSTFKTVAENLSPNDSNYFWVVPTSITGKKDYLIRAVASATNTPIDTTRFFELKQIPAVNIGSDTSFCQGSSYSYTLNAGSGFTSYLWTGGDTTSTLTVTSAGTYSVKVGNSYGCYNGDAMTVGTYLLPVVSSMQITDVTCFNGNDGAVDITVVSGHAPYNYVWSSNDSTQDISSKAAGTYSVIITDSVLCVTYDTAIIDQPTMLASNPSVTNVSCNGGSDGEIFVNMSGGTSPYRFAWSNGDSTEKITGLQKGTYTVIVTDSNNCLFYDTIQVTEPNVLIASGTATDAKCYADSNGAITLTVTGGTSSYSYLWSNGDTSQNLSNLKATTYSIIVTDAKGCTAYDTVTVGQPNLLQLSNTVSNVSCNGGNDGSVDITVSGGTTSYSYAWSTTATTQDIDSLIAGTYTVVVTDANNCMAYDTAVVSQPDALAVSDSVTDASCYGSATGTLDLTVSGGTTPYSYAWNNGDTSQDLASQKAGTYYVLITDSNGCTIRDTATINEPTALMSSGRLTMVVCYNGTSGAIDLTVSGGTTPYSYAWSNSDSTQDISSVSAGRYTVTITDAQNCVLRDTFDITQPNQLASAKSLEHVSCFNLSDGSISLNISGGASPYQYSWSNGDSTDSIGNLAKGRYTVLVTDSNQCTFRDTADITEPDALAISDTIGHVSCTNGTDGFVNVTVTGGTLPYRYAWDNSDTTEDLYNKKAGTYAVLVTDANGCIVRDTSEITEPLALRLNSALTMVKCYGDSSGAIDVTVTGGTSPYNFSWSNGGTTEDLSALPATTYVLTITDSKSCVLLDTFALTQPAQLASAAQLVHASCFGLQDGSATLNMSGGVTPYAYAWSNGDSTDAITGLAKGTYTVMVTDSNNCSFKDTAVINEPDTLALTKTVTDVSCYGLSDGSINISVTGGTQAYMFTWSNGDTTEDVTGVQAGTYSVLISDQNGCSLSDTSVIDQPAVLATSIGVKNLLCFEDSSGEIDLTITGGTKPYAVLWNTNDTTDDLTNLDAGTYYVEVSDANSCNILDTAILVQPTALSGSLSKVDILCYGDSTGSADLTITGGSLPYAYKWSNNDTVEDLSNVPAGAYYLEVTDSNSCTWLDTINIVQPDELLLVLDSLPEREDESNGKAWVTVIGGVGPYQYEWNDPASSTTDTAFNLPRGVYTVKVTDANGCEQIDSIDIPSVLSTGDLILPGQVMIYPNPTEGQIGIYNLEDMGGDVLLIVTDSRGRVVVNQSIGDVQQYQLTMPGNMVDGTYLISLYGSAITVRKHFILLR